MKPLWSREVELSDGLHYRLSSSVASTRDLSSGMYKGNINAAFTDGNGVPFGASAKNDQTQVNCGVN